VDVSRLMAMVPRSSTSWPSQVRKLAMPAGLCAKLKRLGLVPAWSSRQTTWVVVDQSMPTKWVGAEEVDR
jgi:hypothetical protein